MEYNTQGANKKNNNNNKDNVNNDNTYTYTYTTTASGSGGGIGIGIGSGIGSSISRSHTPHRISSNTQLQRVISSSSGGGGGNTGMFNSNSNSTTSMFSLQSLQSLQSLSSLNNNMSKVNSLSNLNNLNKVNSGHVMNSGMISEKLHKELRELKEKGFVKKERGGILDYSDSDSDTESDIESDTQSDTQSSNSIVSSNSDVHEKLIEEVPVDFRSIRNVSGTNEEEEEELGEEEENKYIIILTGLPASGKSTLCKSLIDYLHNKRQDTSEDLKIEVFNAGKIRRSDSIGRFNTMLKLANNSNEDLFNPKNSKKKELYAKLTLNKLFDKLNNLDIAIFDATNSTPERRSFVIEEINNQIIKNSLKQHYKRINYIPIILQIQCYNKDFIKYNIHNKTFNEDYFDKPYQFALKDFYKRLKYYKQQYVGMSDQEMVHLESLITPDLSSLSIQENLEEDLDDLEDVEGTSGKTKTKHDDLYYISITNGDDEYYIYNDSKDFKDSLTPEDELIVLIKEFARTYHNSKINKSYTHRVRDFFKDENGENAQSIEKLNLVLHDL